MCLLFLYLIGIDWWFELSGFQAVVDFSLIFFLMLRFSGIQLEHLNLDMSVTHKNKRLTFLLYKQLIMGIWLDSMYQNMY